YRTLLQSLPFLPSVLFTSCPSSLPATAPSPASFPTRRSSDLELVHAFQFDITGQGQGRFGVPGAARLPLWFIEGMAEYLSMNHRDRKSTRLNSSHQISSYAVFCLK